MNDVLAINDVLERLAQENPAAAKVVTLRYFAGLSFEDVAAVLKVSERTAHRYWTYARAWLYHEVCSESPSDG